MTEFTTWRSLVDGEEISAILDTVLEDFESYSNGFTLTDDAKYQGADFFQVTDTNAGEGDLALERTTTTDSAITPIAWSEPGMDGELHAYPGPDDRVVAMVNMSQVFPGIACMVESTGSGAESWDGYNFRLRPDDGLPDIERLDDGDRTQIAVGTGGHFSSGDWAYAVIDLPSESDDEIRLAVHSVDSESEVVPIPGDELEVITANDNTHVDNSGFGWGTTSGSDTGLMCDIAMLNPPIDI